MKNSTFSAQVANNLLTLLQGYSKTIRLLLVMLLTLTVTTNAWGATLTLNNLGASLTSTSNETISTTTITATGNNTSSYVINYLQCKKQTYSSSHAMLLAKSKGAFISNKTAMPGNIKSVTVYVLTNAASKTTYHCAFSTTECTSAYTTGSTAVNITGGSSNKYTCTVSNAKYFCISLGNTNNGQVYKLDVEYEVDTPPSCTTNPTVSAGSSSNVAATTATVSCSGGITSLGSAGCSIENYGFVYGTSSNPTISNTKVQVGTTYTTTGTAFSKGLTGLTANTTYYVRPYATNGNGTAYGTQTSFKTLELPKYTVTLNAGSGTCAASVTETSAGDGVTLPTPTLDCGDWKFAGWKTTSAVTTETTTKPTLIPAGNYKPTANTTLYAVYQRTETTQGGGGTQNKTYTHSITSKTWSANGAQTLNSISWTLNNNGSYYGYDGTKGQQVGSSGSPATSMTLTTSGFASATKITAVRISTSGASSINGTVSVRVGSTAYTSGGSTTKSLTSTNTQYEFTGSSTGNVTITWTQTSSKAIYFKTIEVDYQTTGAGGTIITTYYHSTPDCGGDDPEPTGYTITFEANGGNKIDKIENATTLPNPLPGTERAHYTFAGWFTDEDCTQAATAGAEINADITLYAKWTPITYTVTFDAGSGTCATEPTQGNFEAGITLPTATPCTYAQENGWRFVGWSETTVSETTVRPAIHTGNYRPTKDIKLHAVYAKTGTAEGAAGEFILSLEYEGTTYYVGQTFDNSKLSAETEQTNAARFTIEDNYLHYEGGYISHVDTTSSPNLTKQADKANAQAWTITEETNTIIFTSTADNTRGLGFNYNSGSPRFAAYKLNEKEKDGETIKYPSTFTKTSVSDAAIDVTTYNSNPSCAAPVDPTWGDVQITHTAIKANCGSTTVLGSEGENGPATISFGGTDLQSSVTVTASDGFLVSTAKTAPEKYAKSVIIYPNSTGNNIGQITQNVHVIADATAKNESYTGTITLTGNDIPGGSQVFNVNAAVTCTQYTITWSVSGDTEMIEPTTFYAGGEWTLPEDPTFDCNGRVFVGWTDNEIVQPQDIAPNLLYKDDLPTIESDITFYAVFAQEGTGDGSGTATVTDVLNREWTEVSGTTYKDWNGKTARSSAVYAGNSAGGNESIQLRSDASKDAAGIITTTSGGKATNITVVWYDETAAGRTLNVYGKKSAYSAVADLRSEDTRGTLLGTIVKGTSTSLTINNDYEYIGLCSNSGAMYLTSIAITWATDGEGDGNATTYTSYTTSCADVTAIRIVEPTTKTFNEGDKLVFDGEVWAINSDGTETNVTNSSYVSFTCDMNKVGTQTVTVSYLGFTATYEITINAVDKWQITWNVSGATNTGLGPKEVAKGTAIGKLPNPKIPDGCEGKTCVGWTESNTVNSDGTEITFITSSTVPTQNTTYYAVFATQSGNAGDGDYVKLTETPADLSGEYLIVYEDSEGSPAAPKAFNGGLGTLDAASNTISVTISNNTIESTDVTDAAKFTITKNGDAYIITSASNFHIGQTSDANGLQSSTSTSYTNTITITEDSANIIGEGGAYLRYNKTSSINNGKETGLRFRYYKSTSYTYQQPIALYKKSGSSASYTDYTTGCHDVTITYYGFTGGYTTNCGGSDPNVITQRVNSSHTIPTCTEITDPTTLGRTFLNLWKDQNGKVHQPGETFIVTQDTTLYAQWKLETTGDIELPADKEDLATTDIVVTGGKTLTIPEGETIIINSLTLKGGLIGDGKSGNYAMPSVWVPEGAKLVRKNTTINLDLVVNSNSYYPFAVPFEVANTAANVNYINPTLKDYANKNDGYGKYYRILEYNGAGRADNGVHEDNWVHVGRTDVKLIPGKGYAISAVPASGQDTVTIRITMNVDNAWLANGEQESITVKEQTTTRNQVTVTAYTGKATDINNGGHQRHAGWNFVANPYLSMFAGGNVANDVEYIKGSINIQNKYTYEDTEVTYVTVPAYNFAYYEQFKLSATKLSPAYSFFVQVGTGGTMTFETAGRQQAPASIAARNAEDRPVKMDVDITLSDNHSSDQTGIIISDRYSEAYEIGRDLEKLFGSAYNLSVYTLMADNTPLAFQALAIRSNMQVIPVGYRAPEQGEYTFRLNEATSSIDLLNEQYEQLVLVDYQTGELTNLLIADYTFYSERTQADNRFAIYAVPRQNAPTDLPNAIGQDKQAQKIIHNGHLYILRDGNVYNGNGQIVK